MIKYIVVGCLMIVTFCVTVVSYDYWQSGARDRELRSSWSD